MDKRVRIPVRVKRPDEEQEPVNHKGNLPGEEELLPASEEMGTGPSPTTVEGRASTVEMRREEDRIDWRDMALRLQAEMENYRKRQQRLAQDQIASDRERLLRGVLETADNLERALAESTSQDGLRRGVEVTYNALMQWLNKQGVERVEAKGRRFDPAWHEAISTVPHRPFHVEPQTVAEVMEPAYSIDGRLLRPARVIVAV